MKAIELTKQHIEKLLEMCEVLYPDYPHIIIDSDYGMNDDLRIHMFNKSSEKIWKEELKEEFNWELVHIDNADVNIHWYEFCCIHLTKKVTHESPIHLGSILDDPIDYLYKLFQENK